MGKDFVRWKKGAHRYTPNCHWCGRPTRLITPKKGQVSPPDMATVDHLRSRFDPTRIEPCKQGERRRVIACHECNQKRGNAEVAQRPIEELQQRSGRHPAARRPAERE